MGTPGDWMSRLIERIAVHATGSGGGALAAAMAALAVSTPAVVMAQQRGAAPAPTGAVVVLEADSLTRDDETDVITAEGSVEARYEGRTLRASRVIYDQRKGTVRAQGGVEIIEADGTVRYAEELEVDDELNAGVAVGFGARLQENATVAANAAVRRPDGTTALDRIVYTACPVCEDGSAPTWALRARRAEQNAESKLITYEGVSLAVKGVPVLYLPYFAHPDPSAGRRAGLLAPDVGSNRRLGAFYQQPVYFPLGESQDLTLAPRVHENVNPLLGFEYRKRFWSGQMEIGGSASYDQDFDGDGEKFGEETFRGHIFGTGSFQISEYWDWGFGVEIATDDLYLSRYDIENRDRTRGAYTGDFSRLLTQLNLRGQDESSYASLNAVSFQGLRETDDAANLPIAAPFGEAERLLRDPLFDGQIRLQASVANLTRREGDPDSGRASLGAKWRKETAFGPGWVFSPFLEGRGDYYTFTDAAETEGDLTRAVGLVGAELRWPFVRPGENVQALIEPVVMAALGSNGGNDEEIPNEDSQAFEVDESAIFRPNAAPNHDLWEPGGRVTAGLRAEAIIEGVVAQALVARRWRETEEAAFDAASNLDGTESDYVGAVSLDFGAPLRADVRFRLDDRDLAVARLDASVRSQVGPLTANARYFTVEESLRPDSPNEEVSGGLTLKLNRNWSLGASTRQDLANDKTLATTARLVYRDACSFLEFSYQRRETDERLGPSEGFRVRLGLTTLGLFDDE